MKTFITILIILAIMIICYYINRYIIRKENKNEWKWIDVKLNLIFSIFIPLSIVLWIIYVIHKIPSLPEKPPCWL